MDPCGAPRLSSIRWRKDHVEDCSTSRAFEPYRNKSYIHSHPSLYPTITFITEIPSSWNTGELQEWLQTDATKYSSFLQKPLQLRDPVLDLKQSISPVASSLHLFGIPRHHCYTFNSFATKQDVTRADTANKQRAHSHNDWFSLFRNVMAIVSDFAIHRRKPEGAPQRSKTADGSSNGETAVTVSLFQWPDISNWGMKPPVEPLSPAAGFVYRVSFDWMYLLILMCLFANKVIKVESRRSLGLTGGYHWKINRHINHQKSLKASAGIPSHSGFPHVWARPGLELDVFLISPPRSSKSAPSHS